MKTVLDIGSDKDVGSEHTLLLEIGRGHCSTAFFHRASNRLDHIRIFSTGETEIEERLTDILQPLRKNSFSSVVVCTAFPQALLFPTKHFRRDYSALNLVYGLPAQAYFHDTIAEWQMVNAYAVPEKVYDVVTEAFPDVQFLHCYTPAIKIYNGYVADNQLSVHFSGSYFRVLLKKDMAVHLVQTYAYQSPSDVVYYLLKICYEFGMTQQDAFVILSGLVEKESNLYSELQQYFINIYFTQQPEISLPQNPHPHYFFTSIYNLAACVS